MPDATSPVAARWMQRWLILIGLMVYAMILIGGATRLTDSGLSITEWAPIKGSLPPLSEAAWLSEFEKYKTTAEFQQQNYNMTMAEFQFIYWWEWGHRLFGRLIGLVAIGGFLWFAAMRWMSKKWAMRLGILIALGGLQGFSGWWMVASGIGETDRLDVAPYRLMTHFGLALLIIAITTWFWLDLSERARVPMTPPLRLCALVLLGLTSVQMLTGALVAGLDAWRPQPVRRAGCNAVQSPPWRLSALGACALCRVPGQGQRGVSWLCNHRRTRHRPGRVGHYHAGQCGAAARCAGTSGAGRDCAAERNLAGLD